MRPLSLLTVIAGSVPVREVFNVGIIAGMRPNERGGSRLVAARSSTAQADPTGPSGGPTRVPGLRSWAIWEERSLNSRGLDGA